LKHHAA